MENSRETSFPGTVHALGSIDGQSTGIGPRGVTMGRACLWLVAVHSRCMRMELWQVCFQPRQRHGDLFSP